MKSKLDTYAVSYVDGLGDRVAEMGAENKGLRERVAQLEEVKEAALGALDEAVGAVQRLSSLEIYAKQAIEDDAWALEAAVTIHPAVGSESIHPTSWNARYWDGVRTLEESEPTIAAALRALRVKVKEASR